MSAEDDKKPSFEKLLLGFAVGAFAIGLNLAQGTKQRPKRDPAKEEKRRRDLKKWAEEYVARNKPAPHDGGYSSKGLPPDTEYPTVTAKYYRGDGGQGLMPALKLTCRKCGFEYDQVVSSFNPGPPPGVEKSKKWMRKKCPRGEANCTV